MMINQVTLIGNLGQDPETRYMPSGDAVTNISVATTKRWTKDGEKKEATEWHKVAAFGKLAEIMAEYLRKGSQVFIQGELRTRKWQDKDGHDRWTTEIIADTMKMLGKKRGEDNAPAGQRGSLPPKQDTPAPGPDDFDDDIPF